MRKTKTGAIRNNDKGKIDYVHISSIADRCFCEYMHAHMTQADGKIREADNWKKGMPFKWYKKSFLGHIQDVKMLMEGNNVMEDGKAIEIFEALMGAKFNMDGMIHTLMKGYKFDRKFTKGELKVEFNKRFFANLGI